VDGARWVYVANRKEENAEEAEDGSFCRVSQTTRFICICEATEGLDPR